MDELIYLTVPGSRDDPRVGFSPPPGVIVQFSPPLHPEDVTLVNGLPVTSPARTLIDLAEAGDGDELRVAFGRAANSASSAWPRRVAPEPGSNGVRRSRCSTR